MESNKTLGEIAKNHNIPCLGTISKCYGNDVAVDWLKIQFNGLADYVEQGRGFTDEQLDEMCWLIRSRYYYLNVAEISIFISKIKFGDYGQFYGVIGPMKIMTALKSFVDSRNNSIFDYESQQHQAQMDEWRKSAVTREEYERMVASGEYVPNVK